MNDITIISVLSISFTFVIILFKQCYKSKCIEISLCGITIKRKVDLEEKEHEFNVKNNVKSNDDIEGLKNSIPLSFSKKNGAPLA